MKRLTLLSLLLLLVLPVLVFAQGPGAQDFKNAVNAAKSKNFTDALANISSAIQKEPSNANYYLMQGNIYVAMDKLNEAIGAFEKAIKNNPGMGPAYLGLAKIYYKQKNLPQVINQLDRAYQNETDNNKKFTYKYYVAKLSAQTGNYSQAMSALATCKQISPQDVRIPMTEADIYQKQDQWPQAVSKYKEALAAIGSDPGKQAMRDKVNAQLAIALFKSGNAAESEKVKASIQDPKVKAYVDKFLKFSGSKAQIAQGQPYMSVGEYDQALSYFMKATEMDDPAIGHLYAGMAYAKKGQNSQAIQQMNQALAKNKDQALAPKIQMQLLRLHMTAGNHTEVISVANQILASKPKSPEGILFIKAQSEYQANRFGECIKTLQLLLDAPAQKPQQLDSYNFLLGLAAAKNGNADLAKKAFSNVKTVGTFKMAAKKQLDALANK